MWSSKVEAFKGQKYSDLKKRALSSGQPFEDTEFLRNEQSLFRTSGRAAGIEWKRPKVGSFQCTKSSTYCLGCVLYYCGKLSYPVCCLCQDQLLIFRICETLLHPSSPEWVIVSDLAALGQSSWVLQYKCLQDLNCVLLNVVVLWTVETQLISFKLEITVGYMCKIWCLYVICYFYLCLILAVWHCCTTNTFS